MRAALAAVALGAVALGAAACAPLLSRERAETLCLADVSRATRPIQGTVRTGLTSDGPASKVELDIGTPDLQGRDPAAEYEACVLRRSGERPSRPLYDLPGWNG